MSAPSIDSRLYCRDVRDGVVWLFLSILGMGADVIQLFIEHKSFLTICLFSLFFFLSLHRHLKGMSVVSIQWNRKWNRIRLSKWILSK